MGGVPIVAINENEFNDVFAKKGSEIKLLSDKIGQKETECAGKTRTSYLARLEYDICLSDAAKFRTEMNGLYTAALPRPMATTTTDSDGKFKLALPSSGKYIIFSTASRAAGSTTEAYLWIVPIDATGGEQSLSLSSNNLWEPN